MNASFHGWVAMWAGIAAVYASVGGLAELMDRKNQRGTGRCFYIVFGAIAWAFFVANLFILSPDAGFPWKELLTINGTAVLSSLPFVWQWFKVHRDRRAKPLQLEEGAFGPLLARIRRLRAADAARRCNA